MVPERRKAFEVGQWTATDPVRASRERSLVPRWMQWPKNAFGVQRPLRW